MKSFVFSSSLLSLYLYSIFYIYMDYCVKDDRDDFLVADSVNVTWEIKKMNLTPRTLCRTKIYYYYYSQYESCYALYIYVCIYFSMLIHTVPPYHSDHDYV